MNLFDHDIEKNFHTTAPLAARMRPRSLDEFVGQEKIIGGETSRKNYDSNLKMYPNGIGIYIYYISVDIISNGGMFSFFWST